MSVRALRRGTMAGRGAPAGTPTTYTIYADEASQHTLFADSTSHATARAGPGVSWDGGVVRAGQYTWAGVYYLHEAFLAFDTSAVAGTITSVTLSLFGQEDNSTPDFLAEARLYDFGTTIENADWVPGDDLASLPLLATWDSAAYAADYCDFVSEAAFVSSINQSGKTRMVLVSDRQRAGDLPSGYEYVVFRVPATPGMVPKLVIESLVVPPTLAMSINTDGQQDGVLADPGTWGAGTGICFTPSSSISVVEVAVRYGTGTVPTAPGSVYLAAMSDPTTPISSSEANSVSSADEGTWKTFRFDSPVALTSGTEYVVALIGAGEGTAYKTTGASSFAGLTATRLRAGVTLGSDVPGYTIGLRVYV